MKRGMEGRMLEENAGMKEGWSDAGFPSDGRSHGKDGGGQGIEDAE